MIMKTIQEKIESFRNGEAIENLIEKGYSLCNISTSNGRVLLAARYEISPIMITSAKEVANAQPKATYCIAVDSDKMLYMLGKEVILDLAYGGKGITINAKIINNKFKLIDVLGGEDNVVINELGSEIKDRTKMILNENGKIEFWDVTLVGINQIGGVIN